MQVCERMRADAYSMDQQHARVLAAAERQRLLEADKARLASREAAERRERARESQRRAAEGVPHHHQRLRVLIRRMAARGTAWRSVRRFHEARRRASGGPRAAMHQRIPPLGARSAAAHVRRACLVERNAAPAHIYAHARALTCVSTASASASACSCSCGGPSPTKVY